MLELKYLREHSQDEFSSYNYKFLVDKTTPLYSSELVSIGLTLYEKIEIDDVHEFVFSHYFSFSDYPDFQQYAEFNTFGFAYNDVRKLLNDLRTMENLISYKYHPMTYKIDFEDET